MTKNGLKNSSTDFLPNVIISPRTLIGLRFLCSALKTRETKPLSFKILSCKSKRKYFHSSTSHKLSEACPLKNICDASKCGGLISLDAIPFSKNTIINLKKRKISK